MFRSCPTSVGSAKVSASLRDKETPQSVEPYGRDGTGVQWYAGLGVYDAAPADVKVVNEALSVASCDPLLSDGFPANATVHSTSNHADAGASTSVRSKMRLVADARGLDLVARSDWVAVYDCRKMWVEQLCFLWRYLDLAYVSNADVSDVLDTALQFPFELVSFDLDWRAALHTMRFRDTLTKSEIKAVFKVVRNYVPENTETKSSHLEVEYKAIMSWVKRFGIQERQIILDFISQILSGTIARQLISSSYPMFDVRPFSACLRLVEMVSEHPLASFTLDDAGYNARKTCEKM